MESPLFLETRPKRRASLKTVRRTTELGASRRQESNSGLPSACAGVCVCVCVCVCVLVTTRARSQPSLSLSLSLGTSVICFLLFGTVQEAAASRSLVWYGETFAAWVRSTCSTRADPSFKKEGVVSPQLLRWVTRASRGKNRTLCVDLPRFCKESARSHSLEAGPVCPFLKTRSMGLSWTLRADLASPSSSSRRKGGSDSPKNERVNSETVRASSTRASRTTPVPAASNTGDFSPFFNEFSFGV